MSRRAVRILDSLRRNAGKLVLATICGLLLAGMTHIVAIIAMPRLTERDAFALLAERTGTAENAVLVVPARGEGAFALEAPTQGEPARFMPSRDPAVAVAACAYDLAEGPLRVTMRTGDLFQSIALHARGTGAFYAITDRAAVRGRLDLLVLTRAQLDARIAAETDVVDAAARDYIRVVAPASEGFVSVRALAAFPSQQRQAAALATSVTCVSEPP